MDVRHPLNVPVDDTETSLPTDYQASAGRRKVAPVQSVAQQRRGERYLHRQAASLVVMRRSIALAGPVLLAAAAAAAPEREGAAGAAIIAVLHAGAQGISTTAEGSDDQQLTLGSWTEGTPDRWMTRLVLVRPAAADVPALTWGVRRPDAYGAVLHPTPWQVRGHPVLILQYQFGAAYTRIELYAVALMGRPPCWAR